MGKNVFDFIKRYKIVREKSNRKEEGVLRIKFENFINSHKECVAKISDFLNVDMKLSNKKNMFFDLEKSKLNICKWKNDEFSSYLKDIEIIESNLKDYLF